MKNVGNIQNNKNNVLLNSSVILHTFEGGGQRKLDIILDNLYPVGSIYISTNNTNPSNYFGGVWERIKGRFLLAADDNTYKIGSTGGEATHKLTVDEIPSHQHSLLNTNPGGYTVSWTSHSAGAQEGKGFPNNIRTTFAGGNQPHNNMPPYLAVYMWERIV